MSPLRLLSRRDVASLATIDDYIEAVESAFRAHGSGRSMPPGLLHVEADGGEFHIKAGGLRLDRSYFAAKVNGGFFGNAERHGLPNIQGVIVLSDGATGMPLAVLDSGEITRQRTGAATAVAARHLARSDSHVVTICGCGTQGGVQLASVIRVLPITQAFVWDVDPDRAMAFAERMADTVSIPVEAVIHLSHATRRSDVIVTCTPSKRPFLGVADVPLGAFVAAVGADSPDKQELDSRLTASHTLVVDILDQCAAVGELHHALVAGLMDAGRVHADLAAIVTGARRGRTSDREVVIFDATGTALQDVAGAAMVYERAERIGVGTVVDLAAP
jgi:ornithine cyclodeaminase/alanine dehydrogenase-like protein (mu-crystallin family)